MSLVDSILTLQNVCKSFDEAPNRRIVLKDVNLNIAKGESIAIIGKSGSGKSTLLNLMSGIDHPDHGNVIIDGHTINTLSEYARTCYRRKNLGFIFQFFNLIPTLTVKENIYLPLELNDILTNDNRQSVRDLLEIVELGDRLNHYPDQLSGGEQQRIAILRAIIHKPSVVFADEPTGNLDTSSGKIILSLLKSMIDDFNTTLILVTHSQEVTKIADKIYDMHDGQLVEQHD